MTDRAAGLIDQATKADRCFAQGARCGYLEGKGRAGCYVLGEEIELSEQAGEAHAYQGFPDDWAAGYRTGYRYAANGEALPEPLRWCALP